MARVRVRPNIYAAMPFLAFVIMCVGCYFTVARIMEYTSDEVKITVPLPPLPVQPTSKAATPAEGAPAAAPAKAVEPVPEEEEPAPAEEGPAPAAPAAEKAAPPAAKKAAPPAAKKAAPAAAAGKAALDEEEEEEP